MQNTMKPINSPDGLFHDGNPYTGELGTVVTSEWLNNVQSAAQSSQDELLTVIRDSGQSADPARKDQLLQALKKLAWGGDSKPTTLAGYGITDALPLSGGKMNGRVDFQPNSRFLAEGGKEGGQLQLQAPQSDSKLNDVNIDVWGNQFRVFNNDGVKARGFYVDLTQCEDGPTTNLLTMSGAPGLVGHFAMPYAPPGWLKCDGSLVSRSTYPGLFAVIGTTYGAGDGSTTFKLPDLRGEFIRSWDYGRGIDEGRGVGSMQNQAVQRHGHAIAGVSAFSNHRLSVYSGNGTPDTPTRVRINLSGSAVGNVPTYEDSTVYAVDRSDAYWPDLGPETRPRNIALLACIKY
ncbi:tail fiber protein [Chromobacterium aquaticum]|uniref:Phage tail protein n=2 Tax=Chromobacterium aquaticum TaxID=467180 RepID=A0ABV8ZR63_9NEIS|nr:tail fiber protein [Chromobacterium aquaticum]MCD5360700.1 tail fiber protein [Chromobacterium aquaticum]